ncbi:N-acetylmuramoyl-L-alanine amidase family protein [Cohnella yongneupensis]|uniref:N-acetylmuramoyl-L-alanine amidase n=1 Tax=Cohnella yongneupensis TaxID=425006 RepID=A0ABW0QXT6_9BACL
MNRMNRLNRLMKMITVMMIICTMGAVFSIASASAQQSNKSQDSGDKPVICIEAGHQSKGNAEKEPIGPGSKTLKAKVSGGTSGIKTKKPEYKLNLEVALKLEKALKPDYKVVMVRRTNEVDLSNKERAELCNKVKADVMIRLHADGSTDRAVTGMTFFYPSANNTYTKSIAGSSREIAETVAKQVLKSTGAKSRGVKARGDLTGFNWLTVPSVLIEMGFMTNIAEDKLLSDAAYQDKIVAGIKAGLDAYDFDE